MFRYKQIDSLETVVMYCERFGKKKNETAPLTNNITAPI